MGPAMQIVTDLVSPECYLLEGVLERLPEGGCPESAAAALPGPPAAENAAQAARGAVFLYTRTARRYNVYYWHSAAQSRIFGTLNEKGVPPA